MVRDNSAIPCGRVAHCLCADGIGARLRLGTDHDSCRIYSALIWPIIEGAKERAVAKVAVLKCVAIFRVLTVTWHGRTRATSRTTFVGHGTGVQIVTISGVVREEATAAAVTRIVRARVVVVAFHGIADAFPVNAMIRHGAGIAVDALPLVETDILAAVRPVAVIIGASIAIIA